MNTQDYECYTPADTNLRLQNLLLALSILGPTPDVLRAIDRQVMDASGLLDQPHRMLEAVSSYELLRKLTWKPS